MLADDRGPLKAERGHEVCRRIPRSEKS
jgi:hypothetical protein